MVKRSVSPSVSPPWQELNGSSGHYSLSYGQCFAALILFVGQGEVLKKIAQVKVAAGAVQFGFVSCVFIITCC